MNKATDLVDEAAGAAIKQAFVGGNTGPWHLVGAILLCCTTIWSVWYTSQSVSERPTRDEMKKSDEAIAARIAKVLAAHESTPLHHGAVSRREWDLLLQMQADQKKSIEEVKGMVRANGSRIDRLIEK